MNVRGAIVVAAFAAGACAVLPACSSSSSPPDGTQDEHGAGSVSLALSAIGPDGATYSVPGGAVNFSSPALAATGSYCIGLASTPTQSFSLPVGAYTATFYPTASCTGAPDAGSPWTLNRSGGDGGGPSMVTAQIVANPVSFMVAPNTTTSVNLAFVIPQIGTVTLGTGTATVGVQVEAGAPSAPSSAIISGVSITSPPMPGSNAAVNMALALSGSTTVAVPYTVTLQFTGPFVAGIDVACVPVVATVTSTAMNANYAAFHSELTGATGKLCFADPSAAVNTPNQVYISISRTGAPSTSVFQSALGAMSSEQWLMTWNWTSPTPIYDGTNLHFPSAGQPSSLNQLVLYTYVGPPASSSFYAITTGGGAGSTTTISFLP
jgi:hypothetical protein